MNRTDSLLRQFAEKRSALIAKLEESRREIDEFLSQHSDGENPSLLELARLAGVVELSRDSLMALAALDESFLASVMDFQEKRVDVGRETRSA